MRHEKIRIISARDLSRKEKMLYEEKAHELNIPYQTLMKQYIAEGLWAHQ